MALESCEFWSAFCEASVEPEVLRPYLPRLVPALMRNMMYGEFDEEARAPPSAAAPAMRRRTLPGHYARALTQALLAFAQLGWRRVCVLVSAAGAAVLMASKPFIICLTRDRVGFKPLRLHRCWQPSARRRRSWRHSSPA